MCDNSLDLKLIEWRTILKNPKIYKPINILNVFEISYELDISYEVIQISDYSIKFHSTISKEDQEKYDCILRALDTITLEVEEQENDDTNACIYSLIRNSKEFKFTSKIINKLIQDIKKYISSEEYTFEDIVDEIYNQERN